MGKKAKLEEAIPENSGFMLLSVVEAEALRNEGFIGALKVERIQGRVVVSLNLNCSAGACALMWLNSGMPSPLEMFESWDGGGEE